MIKLDHAGIRARDLEKSVAFYVEAFGFKVLERLNLVGMDYVFVGNGDAKIEIEQGGRDDPLQIPAKTVGIGHMAFIVDNIAERFDRAVKAGAKIIVPPVQLRPDRKIAFVEDPDGSRIQLIEMLK